MLLKNFLFLGLVVLSAASPNIGHLETRARTGTAVGAKMGSKGKSSSATCPNDAIAGATCPSGKRFTAVQIERAVKQAKAMKVKGKSGKGLHFPAKYKPFKELKAKGVKKMKGSKVVKREEDEGENHALQARRSRGGRAPRTRPKTSKKTPKTPKKTPKKTHKKTPKKTHKKTPKKTHKKTPKKTHKKTPKKTHKKTPKKTHKKTLKKSTKNNCKANGKAAKVGKDVWMFPILDKGVWKPGVFPEVSYIILDSKFNYVKTTERKPGSLEEYQICADNKKGKTKGKAAKGKTV